LDSDKGQVVEHLPSKFKTSSHQKLLIAYRPVTTVN
jgi:hypothetical protein